MKEILEQMEALIKSLDKAEEALNQLKSELNQHETNN
jgi:hypothetical protein